MPTCEPWSCASTPSTATGTMRLRRAEVDYVIPIGGLTRPKKEEAPTLAAFEQRFISEYAEANRQKPSTLEAKRSILRNHLVPTLGQLRLDEIGTAQVQKLKGRLSKRKPKTVNNVLNTLSVMLRIAVKMGRDRAHAVPHRAAQVASSGDGVLRPRGAQAPCRGGSRVGRPDSLARAARV